MKSCLDRLNTKYNSWQVSTPTCFGIGMLSSGTSRPRQTRYRSPSLSFSKF